MSAYVERELKDLTSEETTVTRTVGEFVTVTRVLTVEAGKGSLEALTEVLSTLDPVKTVRVVLTIEQAKDKK